MRRRGFTLVELLVSMTIIVILVGITAAAVMASANGDRIPGAARQTQSMILGARDRAIYAGEPRGVRLISDTDNPALVTSFVFVGAPQSYSRGVVNVEYYDDGNPLTVNWYVTPVQSGEPATEPRWQDLARRGVLMAPCRIRIPADSQAWYTIGEAGDLLGDGVFRGRLSKDYQGTPTGLPLYNDMTYAVTLQPTPLPGEEPRLLPRGVAIDLPGSNVPGWWAAYPDHRDILFNERGTAYGPLAAASPLSLLIVDAADWQTGFRRDHPNSVETDRDGDGLPDTRDGDERVMTFFPASGTVSVAPVDDTDLYINGSVPPVGPPDGNRDDPFRMAESGAEG